jgi:hypothetical protein
MVTPGAGVVQLATNELADNVKVGTLASAVTVTVIGAAGQPLTVLVRATVNTPLPPMLGLLTEVLLMVPVAGAVQV